MKRRHINGQGKIILSSLRLETGLNLGDSDPSNTLLQLRLRRGRGLAACSGGWLETQVAPTEPVEQVPVLDCSLSLSLSLGS